MNSELKLLTTREFNGVALDCYKADNEDDGFWATREQIGRLLGYSEPRIAIGKIHQRNQERLDKFSGVVNLVTPSGGTQATTVYNFKGFLEICRFSNQPNANDVMDFAWHVMDEIHQKGIYMTPAKAEEIISNPDLIIRLAEEVKAERARAAELEMQKTALAAKIEADKSKVIFAEAVGESKDGMVIGTFAKLLKQNGIDVGQQRLFVWFREHGWLMNTWDCRRNTPTQKALNKGFFIARENVIYTDSGIRTPAPTPLLTGKGRIYFLNGFKSGEFQI